MKQLINIVASFILLYSACNKKNEYPGDVVNNFMNNCRIGAFGTIYGPSKETADKYCSCILNKLQVRYTLKEFLEFDHQAEESGELADELLPLIDKCKPELIEIQNIKTKL
ncbi:MAG: hypothetical protein AB1571_00570 [Nanoarchaeota archaeon]